MKKIVKYLGLFILLAIICIIVYYRNLFYVKIETTSFSVDETVDINFTAKFKGKDVTDQVVVNRGTFDGKIGQYEIMFTYYIDGKKYEEKRKIKIIDSVPPALSLVGSDYMAVSLNDKYNDPGYIAIDNYDGNVKDKVTIDGIVDTSKVGKYTLIYTVNDSSGNQSKTERIVQVDEKSPLTMTIKDYNLNDYFQDVIVQPLLNLSDDSLNKTVFIGDYTVLNYRLNGKINPNNIWYIPVINYNGLITSPVTIDNLSSDKTISDLIKINDLKTIVICMGPMNLDLKNPETVIDEYLSFVNSVMEIDPNITIIINSILPVHKSYDETNSEVNNTKINIVNYYLVKMCNDKGIKFLNTAESIKNFSGQCHNSYCKINHSDDNLLTDDGSNKIIDYIKSHL